NCHGRAQLFRNDAPKAGHWLIVRAIDPALHRDAYGARITLRIGERRLRRGVNPCYGYASSHDPRAHFGLGAADHVDGIEVRWPGGVVEDFAGVAADQAVTLARSVYGESGG
ncbi:MAG: ASPIC/UnbV domain-containing protein, partial [Phycisphaerae bacterium]